MRTMTSHRILKADWSECGGVVLFGYYLTMQGLHEVLLLFYTRPMVGKINRAWSKTSAKYLLEVDSSLLHTILSQPSNI